MRLIGTCSTQERARRYVDYLLTLGIEGELRPSGDAWAVWVYSEDDRTRAGQEFEGFLRDPEGPRFRPAATTVAVPATPPLPERDARGRVTDLRDTWERGTTLLDLPATLFLTGMSVMATFALSFGFGEAVMRTLSCTSSGLARGELWRLLTPIFLHASLLTPFGFLHLLMNMLWLRHLGGIVESRKGALLYLALVVASAAGPNYLQFRVAGPGFGGMSGVVYALFGYIWMKSRFDPEPGIHLDSTNTTLMLVWFVLCWTGMAGPIANWVHAGGLLCGVLFALVPVWGRRIRRAP